MSIKVTKHGINWLLEGNPIEEVPCPECGEFADTSSELQIDKNIYKMSFECSDCGCEFTISKKDDTVEDTKERLKEKLVEELSGKKTTKNAIDQLEI